MKPIIAIFGFVFGGLVGAYLGTYAGADLALRETFSSPDEATDSAETILLGMIAAVGCVGGILGWGIATWFENRSAARKKAMAENS